MRLGGAVAAAGLLGAERQRADAGCRRCRSRSCVSSAPGRRGAARRAPGRARAGGGRTGAAASAASNWIGTGGSGYAKEADRGQGRTAKGRGEACVMRRPMASAGRARSPAGDRRALARAITLVESTRPDHRAEARALLARPRRARERPALRVGLTGTPGVGKSSFIESLGLMLTGRGDRVAVLAVDPSSARSGGSILGDKTRMERLARAPGAFIRPSPEPGRARRRRAADPRDHPARRGLGRGHGARRNRRRRPVRDHGRRPHRRLRAADRPGRRRRAAGRQARHHGDGRPDPGQQGRRRARWRRRRAPAPTTPARCGCCARAPATRRATRARSACRR